MYCVLIQLGVGLCVIAGAFLGLGGLAFLLTFGADGLADFTKRIADRVPTIIKDIFSWIVLGALAVFIGGFLGLLVWEIGGEFMPKFLHFCVGGK